MIHHRFEGYVPVGGVVKPHGIRGEICIKSYADSPSLFERVPALYLRRGSETPRPYAVRSWREHKEYVLLTLEGVRDRDQAEALRGVTLLVDQADLPEPDEGEHYIFDMLGCRVVLEDGTAVGELEGFYENAEQDTWVITSAQGREILLPAVPEFVLDVDLDSEVITIAPPEGLLELYLNPDPPKKKKKRKRPTGRQKAEAGKRSGQPS